jgi:prepilin-type N-terminal cleavage/methylation domain-containing protein/prepilin-type processing-associated H-X9-DG protein
MKKKGFTLIELLVVISIIAMLLAILMPALSKVKKIAQRVVCATNLKGLGTAQTVYSQDYDDEYTVQGQRGKHTWDWGTNGWQSDKKDWSVDDTITIGASLYLLVREADVSPKSFICPAGEESEFDGTNSKDMDIIQLYDFGDESKVAGSGYSYQHVSYAFQMPYAEGGGKSPYAADGTNNASFAVMADKSPYFDPRISELGKGDATGTTWTDYVARMQNYYLENSKYSESSWEVKIANSASHGRDGQNVVFADGHASFETTTDVGVQNDGIYVPRGGSGDEDAPIRRGDVADLMSGPVHDDSIQPVGGSDSFLVNDDVHDSSKRP